MPRAQRGHARVELASLALGDLREVGLLDPSRPDHPLVTDLDAVLAERTHRELRLPRHPQLADDDHVERSPEDPRDLGSDRDPSAWQAEHHDVAEPRRRHRGGGRT